MGIADHVKDVDKRIALWNVLRKKDALSEVCGCYMGGWLGGQVRACVHACMRTERARESARARARVHTCIIDYKILSPPIIH